MWVASQSVLQGLWGSVVSWGNLLAHNRSMAGGAGICYRLGVGLGISSFMADFFSAPLAAADPDLAAAIGGELARQRDQIELIASENIASRTVLDAEATRWCVFWSASETAADIIADLEQALG